MYSSQMKELEREHQQLVELQEDSKIDSTKSERCLEC